MLILGVKRKEWSRSLALVSSSLHSSPELFASARVNASVGFIPARFRTVPEADLQGVNTAICHATSKNVKMPFIIWIYWKH